MNDSGFVTDPRKVRLENFRKVLGNIQHGNRG